MNEKIVEPEPSAVARAIELAGGPARVARSLGLTTQAVCFYSSGERRLNTDHGAALEALAGGQVTRQQMWPKSWQRIWPELATAANNASTAQQQAAA